MSKYIRVKNELPELLAAVCNHPDGPGWLSGEIWDSFNNRMLNFEYTANYFRYALEQVEDVKDRYSCGQPVFPNARAWHSKCDLLEPPETVQ